MLLVVLFGCGGPKESKTQKENEWIKLFNGTDLNDWIVKINHHDAGVNFGNTFRAEDGMIKVRYDQYEDFNDQFSHLYYKQPFSHFHLKLEYHFTGELQKRRSGVYLAKQRRNVSFARSPRHAQGAKLANLRGDAIFGGTGRRESKADR